MVDFPMLGGLRVMELAFLVDSSYVESNEQESFLCSFKHIFPTFFTLELILVLDLWDALEEVDFFLEFCYLRLGLMAVDLRVGEKDSSSMVRYLVVVD